MLSEPSDRRKRFYNRVAKSGLISSAAGFGLLIALVFLPLDRNTGMVVAGIGVLALILSAVVMIVAIAARDIPTWRKNRWRFSTASLLTIMFGVAMSLGSIMAAERGVSVGRMLFAIGGLMVVYIIVYSICVSRLRIRHFNSMHAQGRYLGWALVADRIGRGEGTLLVGPCYQITTVWWSDRTIRTLDEARSAIDADALITLCPQRTRVCQWLKMHYPAATIFDMRSTKTVATSAT